MRKLKRNYLAGEFTVEGGENQRKKGKKNIESPFPDRVEDRFHEERYRI